MTVRRRILTALVGLTAGALAAGATASAAAANGSPKLKVRLIEFQVKPKLDFIAAGKTKFVVKNGGTEEHELVVVRGDDPAALPTAADGSVDESQIAQADEIGELEEIKAGKTKSTAFKLPADSYILFCNIVETEEDGTVVSHFAEGMYTTIDAS
jgi:hypothetical protein